jgi:hypothetical protein
MSELTLFQSGNQLPAHLRRGELSDLTKSLMGGGTSKRISIENNVWRMLVGGKEVAVNEDRAMNVIIIRAADANRRTFYGTTYEKGMKARPKCWSDDGIKPHEKSTEPQNRTCAGCPQDVKGSGQNESKACRYSRPLALLLENDVQGDIYAMSINASSLFGQGEGRKMGLQQYARFLGGHGVEVNAVVTEMRFDTSANMKLTFSAVRPLEEAEYAMVLKRKDEKDALDAVTMTVGEMDGAPAPTPAAPAAPLFSAAPAPAPAPVAAPKPTPKATPAASGFKVSKAAPAPAEAEPVVRDAKPEAPAPGAMNVNALLSQWGDDVDD